MPRSLQRSLPPMEVKELPRREQRAESAVKELPEVPLHMAKAGMGGAIGEAIEGRPLKAYGHEGLLSEVRTGARVPDYLARIYQDPAARRKLALALLRNDADIVITTTIAIPTRKVGLDGAHDDQS